MKYIRTKGGKIYKYLAGFDRHNDFTGDNWLRVEIEGNKYIEIIDSNVDRFANTIEELCDELVIKYKNEEKPRYVNIKGLIKSCDNIGVAFRRYIEWLFVNYKDQLEICNGAIWTDKGLIYVAKMNDKGELGLL